VKSKWRKWQTRRGVAESYGIVSAMKASVENESGSAKSGVICGMRRKRRIGVNSKKIGSWRRRWHQRRQNKAKMQLMARSNIGENENEMA
jgi:hypothetical protein